MPHGCLHCVDQALVDSLFPNRLPFDNGTFMARPSRKTEIRERVLAEALQLISQGGFQQSPMSQLAKQAGVSVGTIYLYFANKDDLILALFETIRVKMQNKIFSDYSEQEPIKTRFEKLFSNLSTYYVMEKNDFIFIDQFGFSQYNKSSLDSFSARVVQAFLNFYRDGIAQKELKPFTLDVVMSLVHGPIVSLMRKHHSGFTQVSPALLRELAQGVWEAIAVTQSPSK